MVGRFTARHVVETRKTEPGPGASVRPASSERDGWYIDLPSSNCRDLRVGQTGVLVGYTQPAGTHDRVQIKHLGTARPGYAVEQTSHTTDSGGTITSRLELLQISENPLPPALFDIPADYRPALPRWFGGFDLTKPDTFANRVEAYWQELVRWVYELRR